MSDSSPVESRDISAIMFPPYSMRDPKLWFIQIESIFEFRRIKSQNQMYHCIVAHLPTEVAAEIRDIICNKPESEPYNTLKQTLISRTANSDEHNLRVLLSGVDIGDRTPSQLLRHMTALQGERYQNDSILKELWLKNLPSNIRNVLSVIDKETPLPKMAEIADQVHSNGQQRSPTVQNVAAGSDVNTRLDALDKKFSELCLHLAAITSARPQRTQSPPRRRSMSRNRSPTPRRDSLCKYHRQFGMAARNCRPFCKYYSQKRPPQGNDSARL